MEKIRRQNAYAYAKHILTEDSGYIPEIKNLAAIFCDLMEAVPNEKPVVVVHPTTDAKEMRKLKAAGYLVISSAKPISIHWR